MGKNVKQAGTEASAEHAGEGAASRQLRNKSAIEEKKQPPKSIYTKLPTGGIRLNT